LGALCAQKDLGWFTTPAMETNLSVTGMPCSTLLTTQPAWSAGRVEIAEHDELDLRRGRLCFERVIMAAVPDRISAGKCFINSASLWIIGSHSAPLAMTNSTL